MDEVPQTQDANPRRWLEGLRLLFQASANAEDQLQLAEVEDLIQNEQKYLSSLSAKPSLNKLLPPSMDSELSNELDHLLFPRVFGAFLKWLNDDSSMHSDPPEPLSRFCALADGMNHLPAMLHRDSKRLKGIAKKEEMKLLTKVKTIEDRTTRNQLLLGEDEQQLVPTITAEFKGELTITMSELEEAMIAEEEARKIYEAAVMRTKGLRERAQRIQRASSFVDEQGQILRQLNSVLVEYDDLAKQQLEGRVQLFNTLLNYAEDKWHQLWTQQILGAALPQILPRILQQFTVMPPDLNYLVSQDQAELLNRRVMYEAVKLFRRTLRCSKYVSPDQTALLMQCVESEEDALIKNLLGSRSVQLPSLLGQSDVVPQYFSSTVILFHPQHHIMHETPPNHVEGVARVMTIMARIKQKVAFHQDDDNDDDDLMQLAMEESDNDGDGFRSLVLLPCADVVAPPQWCLPLVHSPEYLARLEVASKEAAELDLFVPLEFDSEWEDTDDEAEDAMNVSTEDDVLALEMRRRRGAYGQSTQGSRLKHGDVTDIPAPLLERIGADRLSTVNDVLRPNADDIKSAIKLFAPTIDESNAKRKDDSGNSINNLVDRLKGRIKGTLGKRVKTPFGNGTTVIGAAHLMHQQVVVLMDWGSVAYLQPDQVKSIRGRASRRPKSLLTVDGAPIIGINNTASNTMKYAPTVATAEQIAAQLANRFSSTDLRLHKLIRRMIAILRLQRHITTRTNVKDANLSLWMHGRTTAGMSRAIEGDIKNWLKRFDRRKLEELIETYEAKPLGTYLENDFLADMEKIRNLNSKPYDDSFVGPQYVDLLALREEAMAYAQSRLVTKSGATRAKPYRKSRTSKRGKNYDDDYSSSGGGFRGYQQQQQEGYYYGDEISPRPSAMMMQSGSGDMSPSAIYISVVEAEWQPQSTTDHVQQLIQQQPMRRHPGKRGTFVPAPPGCYPDHGMKSFQENMRFLFVNLSARLRVSQSFFIQSILPQYQTPLSNGNTYSQSLLSNWLRYRASEQSTFEVNSAVLRWCNDYRSSLTPEEVTKLQSSEEFFALASAFAQPSNRKSIGRSIGVRIPRPKQQSSSSRPSTSQASAPMPQHELLLPDASSGFGRDVSDDFVGIEEMAVAEEDDAKNDEDEEEVDPDLATEQQEAGLLDFNENAPLPKIYTEEMSQALYQAFLAEISRREVTHAYISNEAERIDITLAQPIISRFVKAGIVPYTGKRHDFCRTLHRWISFSKTKGRATQPTVISAAVDAKAARRSESKGVTGSLYCSGCGKDSESFARAGQFYEHLATCGRPRVKQESENEDEDDDEEDENGTSYRRATRGLVQQTEQQRSQRYRKVSAIKPMIPFSRERVIEMEERLAHNLMTVNRDPFNPAFCFAICEICGDKGGDMFACASCPWRYHPGCLSRSDITAQADDKWNCPDCKDRGIADAKILSDEMKPYTLIPGGDFLWFTSQHEWRRVVLVAPHTIFSDHIMLFRVINIETGVEDHEASPQWLDTAAVSLFRTDHLRIREHARKTSTGFQYRDRLNENDEDDDKDIYSRPYVSRKRKVSFPAANNNSDDDEDAQQQKAARRGYGWSPGSPTTGKKRGRKPKQEEEEGGGNEVQQDTIGGLGIGMSDTYISATSVDAAMSSAGIACRAVDIVMQGQNTNAFAVIRPPGHHAGRHGCTKGCLSTGFCLLNNAVMALTYARVVYGLRKVAVVDIDVHYGNGTAELLRDDEDAFFASVHMIHGEHNDGQDPNPISHNHGVEGEVQGFYPPLLGTLEVENPHFVSVGVQPEPGYGPRDPPPKKKRRGRRRRTWVVESEEEEDEEVVGEEGETQVEQEEDEELVSEDEAAAPAASSSASSAMIVASDEVQSEEPQELQMVEESSNAAELSLQPQELKGRQGFLTGLEKIILPKLEEFQPELLIISAGFDGYFSDPLGGSLQMTEEDYAQCTQMLMKAMERITTTSGDAARSSRVISLLEGGYDTAPLTLGLAKCAVAHVLMLKEDINKQDTVNA